MPALWDEDVSIPKKICAWVGQGHRHSEEDWAKAVGLGTFLYEDLESHHKQDTTIAMFDDLPTRFRPSLAPTHSQEFLLFWARWKKSPRGVIGNYPRRGCKTAGRILDFTRDTPEFSGG